MAATGQSTASSGLPPPVVPAALADVAPRVEARIASFLADEAARWEPVDGRLLVPLAALNDFVLAGGKRLRPAFCHWAWVGAGADPDEPAVVDAGAALELLHTFALLHDDVMDGSHLRRGRATVHLEFSRRHAAAGWRGEARRFGEGVAILVGDLAFVYADQLMAEASPAARAIFDELRIELNVGQYLDLAGTAEGRADRATARRIACYKSGKYTVERPLHLGATMAGRPDLMAALSAFGLPLGEAFQLRDDLLGAFGDETATGKPVGEDLREGKPTPLLALAVERADPGDRRLLGRVGAPNLSSAEVAALQDLLERTGARADTEAEVHRLITHAVGALDAAPLTPAAGQALTELAAYVGRRDR